MHVIVRGVAKRSRGARRAKLRLIRKSPSSVPVDSAGQAQVKETDSRISPVDYSRHLRAIGKDLENLHLTNFNLECTGTAYLVWVRSDHQPQSNNPRFRISRSRLQKLWRNKTQPGVLGHEEPYALPTAQTGRRLRYSVPDLDRIEREQRGRRRHPSGAADG